MQTHILVKSSHIFNGPGARVVRRVLLKKRTTTSRLHPNHSVERRQDRKGSLEDVRDGEETESPGWGGPGFVGVVGCG